MSKEEAVREVFDCHEIDINDFFNPSIAELQSRSGNNFPIDRRDIDEI